MKVLRTYLSGAPTALVLSTAISIVASLVFLTLNAIFVLQDPAPRRAAIAKAIDGGLLSAEYHPYLLRNFVAKVWTKGQNECLILYMLIGERQTRLRDSISPLVPDGMPVCEALTANLAGKKILERYYHRYLHGYRVATAAMLAVVPLPRLPSVLRAGLYGLVLLGCFIAAAGLIGQRDNLRQKSNLGIGLSFLFLWGISLFGNSISFAFGDAVVVGLWLAFTLKNPLRWKERSWIIFTASMGALIAYMEFLTGQIPLALALIPGIVAISLTAEDDPALARRRAGQGVLAFVVGVLGVVVFKQIEVAVVFGPQDTLGFFGQLTKYTSSTRETYLWPEALDYFSRFGITNESFDGPFRTIKLLAAQIFMSIANLGLGVGWLGTLVLVTSFLILPFRLVTLMRSSSTIARAQAELLLISLGLLALWYWVLSAHAIQHMFYMIRPLVWLPMAAITSLLIRPHPAGARAADITPSSAPSPVQ